MSLPKYKTLPFRATAYSGRRHTYRSSTARRSEEDYASPPWRLQRPAWTPWTLCVKSLAIRGYSARHLRLPAPTRTLVPSDETGEDQSTKFDKAVATRAPPEENAMADMRSVFPVNYLPVVAARRLLKFTAMLEHGVGNAIRGWWRELIGFWRESTESLSSE